VSGGRPFLDKGWQRQICHCGELRAFTDALAFHSFPCRLNFLQADEFGGTEVAADYLRTVD